MTPIESELVETSGFKPGKKYQRQDYLAALTRAVNELDEVDFDGLSIEAQDWFNDAVRAINKKVDLPDFPDSNGAGEADDEEASDEEPEVEEASEAEPEPVEASAKRKRKPTKPQPKKVVEPEPEPGEEDASQAGDEPDPEPEEPEADPPTPPTKAASARRKKGQPPRKLPHPEIIDHRGKKPEEIEIEWDKYDHVKGTKVSAACVMFEQGCRMSDVTASIGGTYYNLLSDLTKAGHKVEKAANGMITLTHKDAKKAKKRAV